MSKETNKTPGTEPQTEPTPAIITPELANNTLVFLMRVNNIQATEVEVFTQVKNAFISVMREAQQQANDGAGDNTEDS